MEGAGNPASFFVIASEAKQSIFPLVAPWIASSRSLSSGAHSRDPLAPRNDDVAYARLFARIKSAKRSNR
jgi:hypothetical protein